MQKLKDKINSSIINNSFIKATASKPDSKTVKKTAFTPVLIKGERYIQEETFTTDGKARHINIEAANAADRICGMLSDFRQLNVFAADFEADCMKSKSGQVKTVYRTVQKEVSVRENNEEKNYILSPNKKYDFLVLLGIQDENGRIHDKKQSKFRQINKFLEIVSDVVPQLPEGDICVWDLCCGKSYLSFAVYYYFTFILNRTTKLYGADLKADVIEYCSQTAGKLGYNGMKFICGNVAALDINDKPDMVLSLHACDIATDFVLAEAVKQGAGVILSSPCCQHELASQLDCPDMEFITREPILKQKLSAILTDALRCRLLYACGYKVTTLEFIDPEETPKNLMIRAEKARIPISLRRQALVEYDALCQRMNVSPTMRKLLTDLI